MSEMGDSGNAPDRLVSLRHALERAAANDLQSRSRRGWARHPRRLAIGATIAVIGIPAAAVAATQLISTGQVAASLPQGTRALIGTDPTCTVVQSGIEYHCTLASAPSADVAPASSTSSSSSTSPDQQVALVAVAMTPSGHTVVVHAASQADLKQRLAAIHAVSAKLITGAGAGAGAGDSSATSNVASEGAAPQAENWNGTVEPTVDSTKHVNGGCRSLNSTGTEWDCYIGQAAVQQKIIGQSFLGDYASAPGVG